MVPKINLSKEQCSGCGACENICPVNAIQMVADNEGFYYPSIDLEKCVKCKKCEKICPMICLDASCNIDMISQYGCKHSDEKVRMNSRSGGFFVALSNMVIKYDGVVYGAVMISPDRVEHIRATTYKERDKMCGSKYVQSDITVIYKLLEKDLNENKLVLFTGSPCQCSAIFKLFGKYETLILCDFVCHGVPSQKMWQDYLNWWRKKRKKNILSVDFRDKQNHNWSTHVEKLSFEDKAIYSRRFTKLFYENSCLRPSCYSCPFVINRVSDITIADYWGINDINKGFNDEKGVSLVIVRSDKGKAVFDNTKDELVYFDSTDFDPVHYNLKTPTKCPEHRNLFWDDYFKKGFGYVSRKYGGYDILRTIKYRLIDKIN